MVRGDINSGVSPSSTAVRTVLGGNKRGPSLVLLRRDGGRWPLEVFTHVVAIIIVGGVFDRTGPEIVQYDDSVLSEGSTCISAFDAERDTALPALTERECLGCLVQDPITASGSSTVVPQKWSSAQLRRSSTDYSTRRQSLRPIVFGILSLARDLTVCDIDKQRGRRISTLYHRDRITLSPHHFLPVTASQHSLPIPYFFPPPLT